MYFLTEYDKKLSVTCQCW